MAAEGPLLASVRRLIEEFGDHIYDLPQVPLPVRMWRDEDGELRLDLMIALGSENRNEQEEALGALSGRELQSIRWRGRIASGSMRVADLGRALDPEIDAYVEAASVMRPTLDRSVPEAWQSLPTAGVGQTGAGVIVGIVDSGIDLAHPSFQLPGGGTRVLHYWNQTAPRSGASPYEYGADWDRVSIDALLGQLPWSMPATWIDPTGHGTRVAGVACGNGRGTPGGRYLGVASEADLVVVAIEARRGAFPSTNNVLDAIEYVFEQARAAGKRAVVNLSHGVQVGAHQPADRLEAALTNLLAEEDERIIVVSSGNTGDADAHARLILNEGESADLPLIVPYHAGPLVFADIWYAVGDRLEIEIVGPDGTVSPTINDLKGDSGPIGNDRYEVTGVPNVLGVRANEVHVKLSSPHRRGDVEDGRWTLRLHGRAIAANSPIDIWLDWGLGLSSPRFERSDAEADHTVTAPATAGGVVAVGAYAMSPTLGRLSPSSGRGPARTGSPVEMLAAPGEPVTTTEPSQTGAASVAPAYGTSFAAPHVTGAIALMLEASPGMTRDEVLDCLRRTARSDAETNAGPASAWGAGKLDISAALACVQ